MTEITAECWSNKWTKERTEAATKLWREGTSASVIARCIGGGLSRNAVIGKMHRVCGPKSPAHRKAAMANGAKIAAKMRKRSGPVPGSCRKVSRKPPGYFNNRKPTPEERDRGQAEFEAIKKRIAAMATPAAAKPLLDLEDGDCRWPYGDGPFVFCGCKRAPGASYCQDHLILSMDSRGLAKTAPHVSSARININPFGLEELSETSAA